MCPTSPYDVPAHFPPWGQACRDSQHSFFRATTFGRAANERPWFEKKKQIQLVTLIKESVTKLCEPEHLQLRDWSLDPELLLPAQDMYHAATVEAWPRGEQILKWPDPYDEPTPTYAGSYIMATRSAWLSRHLHKSLTEYKA